MAKKVKQTKTQQALLDRANAAARAAIPQAQHFAKETLVPGAKTVYTSRVVPAAVVGAGIGKAAGRYAGTTALDTLRGTVLPAVSSAAAAAIALANEAAERIDLDSVTASGQKSGAKANAKTKAAVKAGRAAVKTGAKQASKNSDKGGIGFGGTVGIVLGVGALAGIGYAVWQTLRADDDLWVADEDPETTPTSDGSGV
jgi:hypothetical protein